MEQFSHVHYWDVTNTSIISLYLLKVSIFLVIAHLPDLFYLCVMLMGHGPASSKAAVHGVLVNVIHSLLAVPQVIENGNEL